MKYAIMANYYMYNEETDTEYSQWHYLGLEGKLKLFVFDEDITDRTKLFDTAREAGEYLDKHFDPSEPRCSFSHVRIVEVEV